MDSCFCLAVRVGNLQALWLVTPASVLTLCLTDWVCLPAVVSTLRMTGDRDRATLDDACRALTGVAAASCMMQLL